MWWRLARSEFERRKGEANRKAFQKIVRAGGEPGILAYIDEEPVAWCGVAPREQYPVIQRSRTLRPIDDQPVWSVTCLFVARPYRRQSLSHKLLQAAADFAIGRGAKIVEGYPTEPRSGRAPDAFVWTGLPSAYRSAGFREVARPSPTRAIMRYFAP
jgi:GNAT superfamily N-acetyltransferase